MLVYGRYECFVMQMYVCVLCSSCGSSQCCILQDLQFVNVDRGCKRRSYGRVILPQRWYPIPFFWASRASLPATWLVLLLTKAGDVNHESNPGPTTHTNKHTPVIWICDLYHKQINKKQTSIRFNHTHNTHWVHLNCTHIKQRQYKPDWRCTIHTPTQNVTTQLPITN